jgi:heptosyltransferase-2
VTELVWLQTGFIGDVVLTTAAIELAARELPGARQHLVTTPAGAAACFGHPALASVVVFEKSLAGFGKTKRAVLAKLEDRRGAVTLQAHRSYRSSLLARHLGLRTITYSETSGGFLAHERVPRIAVLHEAHRIALLLAPLGVRREAMLAARPKLPPLPLDGDAAWQRRLAAFPGRLVAVAPGSVWGTKRWTVEGFTELARRLLAGTDVGIALIGSGQEKALAATIVAALGGEGERVFDLAGCTSLTDLRRLFPRLALLVGNDSSPLHFASAFDVPTVGLFGATTPAMGFGPLATRARALGVEGLECRPCSAHGPQICPVGHFRCMRELGVDVVLGACREILV